MVFQRTPVKSAAPLKVLVCSANMGNAEPTIESMSEWIPSEGVCHKVPPLKGMFPLSGKFDMIIIGMQESTWSKSDGEKESRKRKRKFPPIRQHLPSRTSTASTSTVQKSTIRGNPFLEEDDKQKKGPRSKTTKSTATLSTATTAESSCFIGKKIVLHRWSEKMPQEHTRTSIRKESSEKNSAQSSSKLLSKRIRISTSQQFSSFQSQKPKPSKLYSIPKGANGVLKEPSTDRLNEHQSKNSTLQKIRGGAMQILKAKDSITLKRMIKQILGDGYVRKVGEQRGQMRLQIWVRRPIRKEITRVRIRGENTGLGGVMANKGGIVCTFNYKSTRISVLSAHLAAHEGAKYYKARCGNLVDIFRGTKTFPHYDAAVSSHHMFVLGDLNFRTNFGDQAGHDENFRRVQELMRRKRFDKLYEYDELQAGINRGEVLTDFTTLPCLFSPTFKVKRAMGLQYNKQRVPSYTDRILFKSSHGLTSNLTPISYEPCPEFITSDHKPIRGAFTIVPNENSGVEENSFHLTFRNLECSNLLAGDSDPYIMFVWNACRMRALDKRTRSWSFTKQRTIFSGLHIKKVWPTTKTISNDTNPKWKDKVPFLLTGPVQSDAMLFLSVMDYDSWKADDHLGAVEVNVKELISLARREGCKEVTIDRPLIKYCQLKGRIKFTVDISPLKGPASFDLRSKWSSLWSRKARSMQKQKKERKTQEQSKPVSEEIVLRTVSEKARYFSQLATASKTPPAETKETRSLRPMLVEKFGGNSSKAMRGERSNSSIHQLFEAKNMPKDTRTLTNAGSDKKGLQRFGWKRPWILRTKGPLMASANDMDDSNQRTGLSEEQNQRRSSRLSLKDKLSKSKRAAVQLNKRGSNRSMDEGKSTISRRTIMEKHQGRSFKSSKENESMRSRRTTMEEKIRRSEKPLTENASIRTRKLQTDGKERKSNKSFKDDESHLSRIIKQENEPENGSRTQSKSLRSNRSVMQDNSSRSKRSAILIDGKDVKSLQATGEKRKLLKDQTDSLERQKTVCQATNCNKSKRDPQNRGIIPNDLLLATKKGKAGLRLSLASNNTKLPFNENGSHQEKLDYMRGKWSVGDEKVIPINRTAAVTDYHENEKSNRSLNRKSDKLSSRPFRGNASQLGDKEKWRNERMSNRSVMPLEEKQGSTRSTRSTISTTSTRSKRSTAVDREPAKVCQVSKAIRKDPLVTEQHKMTDSQIVSLNLGSSVKEKARMFSQLSEQRRELRQSTKPQKVILPKEVTVKARNDEDDQHKRHDFREKFIPKSLWSLVDEWENETTDTKASNRSLMKKSSSRKSNKAPKLSAYIGSSKSPTGTSLNQKAEDRSARSKRSIIQKVQNQSICRNSLIDDYAGDKSKRSLVSDGTRTQSGKRGSNEKIVQGEKKPNAIAKDAMKQFSTKGTNEKEHVLSKITIVASYKTKRKPKETVIVPTKTTTTKKHDSMDSGVTECLPAMKMDSPRQVVGIKRTADDAKNIEDNGGTWLSKYAKKTQQLTKEKGRNEKRKKKLAKKMEKKKKKKEKSPRSS